MDKTFEIKDNDGIKTFEQWGDSRAYIVEKEAFNPKKVLAKIISQLKELWNKFINFGDE